MQGIINEKGWQFLYRKSSALEKCPGLDFKGELSDINLLIQTARYSLRDEESSSLSYETENEMFHMLEGAITFQCGKDTFKREEGGFIFSPRGIEHSYIIQNEEPVRLIVATSPVRVWKSCKWKDLLAEL